MDTSTKKIIKRINSIYDIIDPQLDHLFIKNKLLISAKTAKEMKEKLLEFDAPTKDTKAFNIRIKINKTFENNKNLLTINCTQQTINKKLKLFTEDDDVFQVFTYSSEELIKYGFKLSHIKSMIKAVKNHLVSYEKSSISFTELKLALQ
jgi:hypothetical protein